MTNYGIWTVIAPLATIFLAIYTRQVILSLLVGIVIGFSVIAHFNVLIGVRATLDGIISVFGSAGNTRTILFCFMVGGLIHLIQVTGGTRGLVFWLTEKACIVKNQKTVQLLAMVIAGVIFIESSISIMSSGTATKDLARYYGLSPEKMAYISQATCVSICSSVMINGWGATMMGVVAAQISKGFLVGEPFSIVAHALHYNFMAWLTLFFLLFYIATGISWGPMKTATLTVANQENQDNQASLSLDDSAIEEINHPAAGSIINFLLPLATTVIAVPIFLFITGDGQIAHGSGSTSVFWGVMTGTFISFVWFVGRRMLSMDAFFKHLFTGYASMIPLGAIMTLAFLMGNVTGELNTGNYISQAIDGILPSGFSAAFIFIVACIMSFATGTSFGTFSIMIPIGVQLGVAIGMDPTLMIGAAVSGAIFGDMTSPISDTSIVASMATGCNHIDHIRTQLPYALMTGLFAAILFSIFGFLMMK